MRNNVCARFCNIDIQLWKLFDINICTKNIILFIIFLNYNFKYQYPLNKVFSRTYLTKLSYLYFEVSNLYLKLRHLILKYIIAACKFHFLINNAFIANYQRILINPNEK